MTPEVAAAVEEIYRAYSGHHIDVQEEGQGGAYVLVHDLYIGDQYVPSRSWCGFLITFQYPRADVYPHFLVPELKRADSAQLGTGFSGQPVDWNGRPACQVSRRSNRLNPDIDTAALKLAKVLKWVRAR